MAIRMSRGLECQEKKKKDWNEMWLDLFSVNYFLFLLNSIECMLFK